MTVANRSASSTSNGENNTSSETTCTCYEACGCDLTDRQEGISSDGNYCSPSKKLSAPCNVIQYAQEQALNCLAHPLQVLLQEQKHPHLEGHLLNR